MTLTDRMKAYESVTDYRLTRRIPVVGRMDGKAFHTLTRGLEKPFDEHFSLAMWAAAKALCEAMQGCKIAYVQSDEITVLLTDYDTLTTEAWFDYRLRKMCGEAAAVASLAFSKAFGKDGTFDARFWNLPKEEVCNCFLWRQRDAEKNSITGFAQTLFSDKEIHEKNSAQKIEMMHAKGLDWNQQPTWKKRGVCITRKVYEKDGAIRHKWDAHDEAPIFSERRDYIDKHVFIGGEA